MAKQTVYGVGGFCAECDGTHDHPLHNIVEEFDLPEPEPTAEDVARAEALAKLEKLGLTEADLQAILG